MAEFLIRENLYRSKELNAFDQFAVTRRLFPVLASFKDVLVHPAFFKMLNLGGTPDAPASADAIDIASALGAVEPLVKAVSEMKDEDVNLILEKCLNVTQRAVKDSAGEIRSWSATWNAQSHSPQFDDLSMIDLLKIAQVVLSESIGPFLVEHLSTSTEPLAA